MTFHLYCANHVTILNLGKPPETCYYHMQYYIDRKDLLQCSSYGPLNLLFIDSKILPSILTGRVQKYVKTLIKPNQTGFISGYQGINNVRRALNLQLMMTRAIQLSMLLSLDAERSSTANWMFLEYTVLLSKLALLRHSEKWLNFIYKKPQSNVRVNRL